MSIFEPSFLRRLPFSVIATLALAALSLLATTSASAETVALTNATVHPVSGPAIANATVVVEDGLIEAVGVEIAIPADAEVIDLGGLHLYPGFVHAMSALGLTEISSVAATQDLDELGENNADLRAEAAWNADSLLLPVAAWGGVLTAHIGLRGGVFTGASAVMRVDGWNWEDMTVRSGAGMHVRYPQVGGGDEEDEEEAREAREKALATINDTLDEARAYQKAKAAGRFEANAKLEGLLPVLDGSMPLYIHARERNQIASALDWVAEQGIESTVLVTSYDAQYVAERLAEEQVAVILDGVLTLPNRRWEAYDTPLVAAAKLHEAGVRFAINGQSGDFNAAHARDLPLHAAWAAAHGLPKDVALRSVTLSAAEILGVADRLGSIEPGKEATFFAASGDPLEILTAIERVWVRGRELDRNDNHQWRLYQRYNNRPRSAE